MSQSSPSRPNLGSSTPFSASEAAFTGFSLVRRAPAAVAIWGLVLLAFGVLSSGLMILTLGPQLAAMRTGVAADPSRAMRMMSAMGPIYLVSFVLTPVIYGVLFAAVNRAVLHPAERRLGYLRLGLDELFQAVLLFIFYIGFVVLFFVVILGVVLVSVAFAAVIRGWAVLPSIVAFLAALALVFWLMVRLSMASPMTTDTHQLHLFSSFRMTRGRFWPLFGAYALAFVFSTLLLLVWFVILAATAAAVGGGITAIGQVFRPDTSSLFGYFSPIVIVSTLVGPFIYAVQLALLVGAPAGAYAQLRGDPLADVF